MPDEALSAEQSWSLLFGFDGLSIQLLNQQAIEQPAPPSEDTGPLDGTPGFWVELRDSAGVVYWRLSMPHPIQYETEVPPPEEGGQPGWVADPAPSGAFTVEVPLRSDATILALVGSPPPGLEAGSVTDLATFQLSSVA
jgi:hypothetical protein